MYSFLVIQDISEHLKILHSCPHNSVWKGMKRVLERQTILASSWPNVVHLYKASL